MFVNRDVVAYFYYQFKFRLRSCLWRHPWCRPTNITLCTATIAIRQNFEMAVFHPMLSNHSRSHIGGTKDPENFVSSQSREQVSRSIDFSRSPFKLEYPSFTNWLI